MLEITSPNPRKVYPGSNFYLHFRTNASPELFSNPDAFMAIINPPSFGQYSGTTNIRDGYGVAYFSTKDNAEIDTTADITLELRPKMARALSSSIQVQVVERPNVAGGDGHQSNVPNINPQWVFNGDPFWVDHDWDEKSVAEVIETEDDIQIYVSGDNERLNGLIQRAQRKGTQEVDAIKDFYLEHISFYAFLAFRNIQQVYNSQSYDTEIQGDSLIEIILHKEMQAACDTVVGIMEQMFDFLLTGISAAAASDAHGE